MRSRARSVGLALVLVTSSLAAAGCVMHATGGAVIAREPPPEREDAPGTGSPGAGYVWVRGHWHWNGVTYVWMPGQWLARPADAKGWVPGHWARADGGWVWFEGRWR